MWRHPGGLFQEETWSTPGIPRKAEAKNKTYNEGKKSTNIEGKSIGPKFKPKDNNNQNVVYNWKKASKQNEML